MKVCTAAHSNPLANRRFYDALARLRAALAFRGCEPRPCKDSERPAKYTENTLYVRCMQKNLCCEHTQRDHDTSALGSFYSHEAPRTNGGFSYLGLAIPL